MSHKSSGHKEEENAEGSQPCCLSDPHRHNFNFSLCKYLFDTEATMSMDPGGCRLNGGGGSDSHYGSDASRVGLITLEDLESFSEDQLSDSGSGSLEEDGQAMEEDESNRMFHYWQDAARGHQVEVPRGKSDVNF